MGCPDVCEGNGFSISNLRVNITGNTAGFFRIIDRGGEIRNLGRINPTVSGVANTGALTSENRGTIIASYAGAAVSANLGASSANCKIGGLAGRNEFQSLPSRVGRIVASYANGAITCTTGGPNHQGGLVGSVIHASTTIAAGPAGRRPHYTRIPSPHPLPPSPPGML